MSILRPTDAVKEGQAFLSELVMDMHEGGHLASARQMGHLDLDLACPSLALSPSD